MYLLDRLQLTFQKYFFRYSNSIYVQSTWGQFKTVNKTLCSYCVIRRALYIDLWHRLLGLELCCFYPPAPPASQHLSEDVHFQPPREKWHVSEDVHFQPPREKWHIRVKGRDICSFWCGHDSGRWNPSLTGWCLQKPKKCNSISSLSIHYH